MYAISQIDVVVETDEGFRCVVSQNMLGKKQVYISPNEFTSRDSNVPATVAVDGVVCPFLKKDATTQNLIFCEN